MALNIWEPLPHPITFRTFCVAILVSLRNCWLLRSICHGSAQKVLAVVPSWWHDPRCKPFLMLKACWLIVTNLVKNFVGFAPLGTVLVAMLGVAIAEHSGLLSAAMRMVMGASQRMVTVIVVFAGIISTRLQELGYVVLIPCSNAFPTIGSSPISRSSGSICWCIWWLFCKPTYRYGWSIKLSGITETAAQMLDPSTLLALNQTGTSCLFRPSLSRLPVHW